MSPAAVRAWSAVHKWTSLVSTAFMLMLCVTGLPLIFHHEIDEAFAVHGAYEAPPLGTPTLSLDTMMATALSGRPGEVPLYLSFDEDRPVINVTSGPRPDARDSEMHFASFDWTNAQALPPHRARTPHCKTLEVHFFISITPLKSARRYACSGHAATVVGAAQCKGVTSCFLPPC